MARCLSRSKIRCRRPLAVLSRTFSSPNHEPRLISAFNTSTLIIFISFSLRQLEINEFVVLIQTFSCRSKFSIVLLGGVEICKNGSPVFLSYVTREQLFGPLFRLAVGQLEYKCDRDRGSLFRCLFCTGDDESKS